MTTSNGPRILAFHAGATTPAHWDPVRAAAPELRFHVPDMNRTALALPPDARYGDLIEALVEQAPPGPLVLAGATFGARIALSVAVRLGSAVRAIYLLTPTTPDESPEFLTMLAGMRRFAVESRSEERIATQVAMMIHRYGPRFARASAELAAHLREGARLGHAFARISAQLDEPPIRWIDRIAAPIEIRFGGADPLIQPVFVEPWRAVSQVRSLEIWPNVGHQIALEAPDRVAADLRRLVAETAGMSAARS